mmetsp:Transcript_23328/g.49279  ORF Transcript_23328/g.49279 Transcript_23328/m.49279 type:complete len:374 (+) Transcript_23328:856-1977(+)
MTRITFLKSMDLPLPSVSTPSSITCSKTFNTSRCAFSISSNSTTEWGALRTASVNCPPSSYPTYPGGGPVSRDAVCFSMYSLMSIRINASSVSNMNSDRAFANSVFPTPVGPRKIMDAMGFEGSFNPARDRWMDCVTTSIASSCPTTRSWSLDAMANTLFFSESSILLAGMPVHALMTLAISSATTSSLSNFSSSPPSASICACSSSNGSAASNRASNSGSVPYLSSAARSKSYSRSAFSISNFTWAICSCNSIVPSTAPFSAIHRSVRFFCRIFFSTSFCSMCSRRCRLASAAFPSNAADRSLERESFSISSWMMRLSTSSRMVGLDVSSFLSLAQASSIRSMALSGKNRSGKYRLLNFAAANNASSLILTP